MMPKIRQRNIVRMRRNNPCATLQEIGSKLGVTRERVRQVLKQAGRPTVAYHQTYLCIWCGKDIGTRKGLFCSRQCQHNYTHAQIACSYCGKLREYSIKWLIWQIKKGNHSTNLFFCSKYCQGKWLAENYGFVQWDWLKVYQLRDKTGWGGTKISRALGIPESTVYRILSKR